MLSEQRRDRQRNDPRNKILAAARKLFLAEGFELVSIRIIATAIEYPRQPGVEVTAVKAGIESSTQYIARTSADFEQVTRNYILKSTGILINFGIAIGLGFVVGLLIAGQTFLNFTLDNLRYYATLKALATPASTLVKMVLVQVLSVTWISFGLGVGIVALTGMALAKSDLAFLMRWEILAMTGGAMLVVGLFAALISLAKVLRLEPAVVFRGG